MSYLSKDAIAVLEACNLGGYGACCLPRSKESLADILVHAGLLLKVDRLTHRTTANGVKRLAKTTKRNNG